VIAAQGKFGPHLSAQTPRTWYSYWNKNSGQTQSLCVHCVYFTCLFDTVTISKRDRRSAINAQAHEARKAEKDAVHRCLFAYSEIFLSSLISLCLRHFLYILLLPSFLCFLILSLFSFRPRSFSLLCFLRAFFPSVPSSSSSFLLT
jgi:hypothetical protein